MALTSEQFRQELAKKITSKEGFDALLFKAWSGNGQYIGRAAVKQSGGIVTSKEGYYYCAYQAYRPVPAATPDSEYVQPMFLGRFAHAMLGHSYLDHSRWWLMREWLRIQYGVYSMTNVLGELAANGLGDFAIHCTSEGEDKALVAYTPDPEAGAADKQVRTTLSKLLRKIMPSAPDHSLRDMEAMHRADLNDELTLLTGDDIVRGYREGPTSCMAHEAKSYGSGTAVHPTKAYDAPGFALAVLHGADNSINARALTWVNPDDPTDRRFVRIYGDNSLRRKLLRNGYRCAGLAGARLRRIEDPRYPGMDKSQMALVVPYLDPPGGGGSGINEKAASVGIFDGEWIKLIDSDTSTKLRRMNLPRKPFSVSASGGVVVISRNEAMSVDDLSGICSITGAKIDMFDSENIVQVYRHGTFLPASKKAVVDAKLRRVRAAFGTSAIMAYIHDDEPWFMWCDTAHLDNQDTRMIVCGQRLLSERYYPEGTWVDRTQVMRVNLPNLDDASAYLIRKDDAVDVIVGEEDSYAVTVHVSEVKERSKYKTIHRINSERQTLVHKDNINLVRTVGGRWVIPGAHDVTQLWDGTWEFSHNTAYIYMFGQRMYHSTSKSAPRPKFDDQYVTEAYKNILLADLYMQTPDARVMKRRVLRKLAEEYILPYVDLQGVNRFRGMAGEMYNTSERAEQTYDSMIKLAAAIESKELVERDFSGLGYTFDDSPISFSLHLIKLADEVIRGLIKEMNSQDDEIVEEDSFVVAE